MVWNGKEYLSYITLKKSMRGEPEPVASMAWSFTFAIATLSCCFLWAFFASLQAAFRIMALHVAPSQFDAAVKPSMLNNVTYAS